MRLVEYAKVESECRYGNGCDTKRPIVRGSFCFKYLGSQVAADGGCERVVVHRMNEGYIAWGAQKSAE